MPLVQTRGAASAQGFGEFAQAAPAANYIEDVFSTWLYTGNGSTQAIGNGIALASTASWIYINNSSQNSKWITADSSGVYQVGSFTGNFSSITKTSAAGLLLFNRTLSGSGGNDFYNAVTLDSAGNVLVAGRNQSGVNGTVVKYNSSGAIQWQSRLILSGQTIIAQSIACDSSNNVYVTGAYGQTGYSWSFIAKYNSSGALQWQRFLSDTTANFGTTINGICVGASGDVYVAGVAIPSSGTPYAVVAKLNTSGALQWSRALFTNYDAFTSIGIDSSDNIYVGGTFSQLSTQYGGLVKYNSSGTLQWQIRFQNNSSVTTSYTDTSGNSYVSVSNTLLKIDSSGALSWQRLISGASINSVYADATTVYVGTTIGSIILTASGSTTSGTAGVVNMAGGSVTVSTGSITAGTSNAAISTASMTETAGSYTDAAGTVTASVSTQVAVTSGAGMVWIKDRSGANSHVLVDTARGATNFLRSNSTNAQVTDANRVSAFNASGFSVGNDTETNGAGTTYASWTFEETPKFFDVVTYTGNGTAGRTIAHNLGSVPGMLIVKQTNASGQNWIVWHRSIANTQFLMLNRTDAVGTYNVWNNTTPTSTVFSVSDDDAVNGSGNTYVAYLFAHDAGGFGAAGTDNVISCGTFTTDGSGNLSVNLGYEPQYVLMKRSDSTGNWFVFDVMRGLSYSTLEYLYPNLSSAAATVTPGILVPTATGFANNGSFGAGATYIYMAIRRPMKPPTSGTQVFIPANVTSSGTQTTNFVVDATIQNSTEFNTGMIVTDRLRGFQNANTDFGRLLFTASTAAEDSTNYQTFTFNVWNDRFRYGTNATAAGGSFYSWNLSRRSGFFDVVCYTGTGSARTVAHNLTVAPELMIVKRRSSSGSDWWVYNAPRGATKSLRFTDEAEFTLLNIWNNTAPTSSVFTVGADSSVNGGSSTYVAYLFASVIGVSKVGSYTGTGATQTIDCGFTAGARFVLIKRTDSTGNWWVWDTARGMVSGTDPRVTLNLQSGTGTNNNWVFTVATGFQIVTTDATVNASGGSYIYLAIA